MSRRERRSASTPRQWKQLDGVRPTAIEALEQRRSALQVLRDIDALLHTDDENKAIRPPASMRQECKGHLSSPYTTAISADANREDPNTPGPGAYDPETGIVDKNVHFMASFDAYAGRTRRSLPWKLKKRSTTPGPGSYTTSRADSIVRPRVLTASFSQQSVKTCCCRSDSCASCTSQSQTQQEQPRSLPSTSQQETAPPQSQNTRRGKAGFVGYMPPTKPNYRTLEQRKKIRSILASRTRWQRMGGSCNVSHTVVERRLGCTGIVSMAKQTAHRLGGNGDDDGRNRESRNPPTAAQLRRRLRAWQSVSTDQRNLDETSKRPQQQSWKTQKQRQHAFETTPQWQRARTSRLLRAKELKEKILPARQQHHRDRKPSTLALLPAHDMGKHIGRDIVRCRRKKLKVVTSFSAHIQKECVNNRSEERESGSSGLRKDGKIPGLVPFAKVTGRDAVQPDKDGLFLLGKEQEDAVGEGKVLELELADSFLRPHVPSAIISEAPGDEERFPMTTKLAKERDLLSILEPKYGIIEKSVPGHRFVRFEKQIDRPEIIPRANNQQDAMGEQQLVLPSEFPILDKLKFPSANVFVDFNKTQGRAGARDDARHKEHSLDAMYEPHHHHELQRKRVSAPVDMSKMLSRSEINTVRIEPRDDDKDRVMCKLRANHEEVEKAMRLLSKFKRHDVGFVDMKKSTTARFPSHKVDEYT